MRLDNYKHRNAFQKGVTARSQNKPITDNPYKWLGARSAVLGAMFEKGWKEQDNSMKAGDKDD